VYSYQGHISRDYSTNAVLNQNDSAVIAGSEDGSVFAWDLVEVTQHALSVTLNLV